MPTNIPTNYICAAALVPDNTAPIILTLGSAALAKAAWWQAQHLAPTFYFEGSAETPSATVDAYLETAQVAVSFNGGAYINATMLAGVQEIYNVAASAVVTYILATGAPLPFPLSGEQVTGAFCTLTRLGFSIPFALLPTVPITAISIEITQGAGSCYAGNSLNCVVLAQDVWTDAGALWAAIGGATPAGLICATPVYMVDTGDNLHITCATPGASIRYRTDGGTPSEYDGTIYTAPFAMPSGYFTVQAIAYAPGYLDSAVENVTWYDCTPACAAPVFSPGAGSYGTLSLIVTIGCATNGATLRYTTDGSTPSATNGADYSGPILLTAGCTLQAIAFATGLTDSAVVSVSYVITAPPSPGSGAGGSGHQVTAFNLVSGTVSGGYSTPYTVSFPVRDRSSRGGLYLFSNDEDTHFDYSASGPGLPVATALYQYVSQAGGTPLPLTGIGFPFAGNVASPEATPLIVMQNYAGGTPWNGLFASDTTGNFYVPVAGAGLYLYPASGTAPTWHPWAPYGAVLQMLWSADGHLYTVERTYQGTGLGTFKDVVYKYALGGAALGLWYAQTNFLPQSGVPQIPVPPAQLIDVSVAGNVYGVDLSSNTLWGRQGSPYSVLFDTALPTSANPLALCLCEALGYIAVLCATPGGTVPTVALGNDNGMAVWDAVPPYASCHLYLYNLTTGATSGGSTLPFTPSAIPEYCGLLFDGTATLYVVDKFNGYAQMAVVQQLAACRDPYGLLHVAYVSGGNIQYVRANPATGALASPLPLGAGSKPALLCTGNRLRASFQDAAGNYVVLYSTDRGGSWSDSSEP